MEHLNVTAQKRLKYKMTTLVKQDPCFEVIHHFMSITPMSENLTLVKQWVMTSVQNSHETEYIPSDEIETFYACSKTEAVAAAVAAGYEPVDVIVPAKEEYNAK